MLQLWRVLFMAVLAIDLNLFAVSGTVKTLSGIWKCADGAPCLGIVRPRGGVAVVGAEVDTFKLEISVHRREKLLQKWLSSSSSTLNVQVTWYRLVEKRIRITMTQCKDKVICVVSLRDAEAMANSDVDYGKADLIRHHFQVSVNYKGHKPFVSKEISIERKVMGSEDTKSSSRLAGEASRPKLSPAEAYIERKNREKTEALRRSGLYSWAEDEDADQVYETRSTDNARWVQNGISETEGGGLGSAVSEWDHLENDASWDDANDLPESESHPKKSRRGAAVTVIILICIAVATGFLLAYCLKRRSKSNTLDQHRYQKMKAEPQASPNLAGEKTYTGSKSSKPKRKPWRVFTEFFVYLWSLLGLGKRKGGKRDKRRKGKKKAPKMSTGIDRRTGSRGYDRVQSDNSDGGSLLDDEQVGEGDVEESDADEQPTESMPSKFGRKFKEKTKDNRWFNSAKAAAMNTAEGKGTMGNSKPFGPLAMCCNCIKALGTLLCPIFVVLKVCCEIFCGWCQGNQVEKARGKAADKLFEFMPSRGPTNDEDEEGEEDHLLFERESTRKAVPMPSMGTNLRMTRQDADFASRPDIRKLKIHRDSSSCGRNGERVMLPSPRALNKGKESRRKVKALDSVVVTQPTSRLKTESAVYAPSSTSLADRNQTLHPPAGQPCKLRRLQQKSTRSRVAQMSPSRPHKGTPLPPPIPAPPPSRGSESRRSSANRRLLPGRHVSALNKTAQEGGNDILHIENERIRSLRRPREESASIETCRNARGRSSWRSWLAQRRSRRRELSLQQEELHSTLLAEVAGERNSSDSRAVFATKVTLESQDLRPPPLPPKPTRFSMPRMGETLQRRNLSTVSRPPQMLKPTKNRSTSPENVASSSTSKKTFNALLRNQTGAEQNAVVKVVTFATQNNDPLGAISVSRNSNKRLIPSGVTKLNNDVIENGESNNGIYSVVNKQTTGALTMKNRTTASPRSELNICSSTDGEYEYLSAPSSPRKLETALHTSSVRKESDHTATLHNLDGIPPPLPARQHDVKGTQNTRQPSPRKVLDYVTLEFLHEEEYESASSDDGEDEFWRVKL